MATVVLVENAQCCCAGLEDCQYCTCTPSTINVKFENVTYCTCFEIASNFEYADNGVSINQGAGFDLTRCADCIWEYNGVTTDLELIVYEDAGCAVETRRDPCKLKIALEKFSDFAWTLEAWAFSADKQFFDNIFIGIEDDPDFKQCENSAQGVPFHTIPNANILEFCGDNFGQDTKCYCTFPCPDHPDSALIVERDLIAHGGQAFLSATC